MSEPRLTHLDESGAARMVDVSAKASTEREATARARVRCDQATFDLISKGQAAKGDVLGVARIAGIMAAKRTPELIPLCHPLPLTSVEVDLRLDPDLPGVQITATARCTAQTGVEMEALTAATVAALTVIDMAKASDRWMSVEGVGLVAKRGGKSGEVARPAERAL
ncbi:MAG TPA: cyclic pyranopterin monophosphate synthase MoaC [Candidatus Dormibacteraeota bacterium]|jgi:cyclic pyranopterin phosphate synthase|nr:cyclic pyranopterin monophosphate synthase MoaC [Candidatus Dormibacteraeota bacterium]